MAILRCRMCSKSEVIQPIRSAYCVAGVCTKCRNKLRNVTKRTLSLAVRLEQSIKYARMAKR